MKTEGVRTQHPQYIAMADQWRRCRDAAAGEARIHEAGERYLPRLAAESDKDYRARKNRTPFFNATWRTIDGMRGMIFRKDAELEAPAAVITATENIDGAGRSLADLVSDVVAEALTVGRIGLLVDYPQSGSSPGMTVAAVAALGLRPTIQTYKAEAIINWRTTTIANVTVLSQVVLCEESPIGDDEFSHETEPRYRVLDLIAGQYRQRVFRINDKGGDEQVGADIVPLMNGVPLAFIPFQFVGVDCLTSEVMIPPLVDLVDMNLKHYAVSADYEHGCHFSGLPTLFISGYSPQSNAAGQSINEIYIGGPTANCLPSPDSKAYFVETASSFEALRTNLEDKKAQMAVLGARMLEAQQRGVETAEAVAQHRKGEESLLSAASLLVSRGVSTALSWFARWLGAGEVVEYRLNSDFTPGRMAAVELTALVGAWQSGAISGEVLFENLQAGEIINADETFEAEQARIANAGPSLLAGAVE